MKRLLAIVLSLGMLGILAAPVAAQRPATNGLLSNIDVTGVLEDGGTFAGVLSITEIALTDGVLEVTGTLSGTATDAAGTITEITDQIFTTTASLTGDGEGVRCDILFLDLGPISLDLLGLNVDLSQIILDVYAVPGAGNLLGNLLCAVAGLLDGGLLGGVTAALENLINQINRLL